jgi:hypothetical protein
MAAGGIVTIDNGTRGVRGVVASVVDRDGGSIRIIFDDVERGTANKTEWHSLRLFTWTDLDATEFAESAVSRDRLAEIGFNLVSRLAALSGRTNK